ncbi:response regulator transcription factor [Enterococcus sp. AZ109]|uniref:response regulator transcription factor n=1 Tax=Enterococcus sp. AZ109 TaxID=2774634 RepID=UPI003F2454A9
MKKKILIVEDDPQISKLLQISMQKINLDAVAAYSGSEGLLQLQLQEYDLILLDLMLPGVSGEELIVKIRETSKVPIIVISAKQEIDEKVQVLKMGADDYITKPFHQEEVAARVEVQLRKAERSNTTDCLSWRKLAVNRDKIEASFNGHELHVTNAEFDILCLLMERPEHAFSKSEIYEAIWKGTYLGDDNTISVHISNLRKKIALYTEEEYIKTIWGIGFMLV